MVLLHLFWFLKISFTEQHFDHCNACPVRQTIIKIQATGGPCSGELWNVDRAEHLAEKQEEVGANILRLQVILVMIPSSDAVLGLPELPMTQKISPLW